MKVISKNKAVCLSAVTAALMAGSAPSFSSEKQVKKPTAIEAASEGVSLKLKLPGQSGSMRTLEAMK